MSRCNGVTRVGNRCSVTNSSKWTDDHGRLVAGPLQKGGEFCLFHAKPFCTKPTRVNVEQMVVVMLDLETTGIDIVNDRIIEVAAVRAHGDARMKGECFSTTVCVDPTILKNRGQEAFKVHGITDEEIRQGPRFKEAWMRFLKWINDVVNITIQDEDSDEDMRQPTILSDPVIVMVAHNGFRFDFPMLLCELLRHGLSTAPFAQWFFIDTLQVFRSLNEYGCIKLQCTAKDMTIDSGSAHRALDDCIALWKITTTLAARIGISMKELLSRFVVELDMVSSTAQLSTLM
jgi:DNA polymerase III alpha subunit (gram-positive type)